jgi:hypothetical protein
MSSSSTPPLSASTPCWSISDAAAAIAATCCSSASAGNKCHANKRAKCQCPN